MYTRAAPGEMYTRAAGSGPASAAAEPLLRQSVPLGQAQGSSLLSLAGRAELKLCTWVALAYFFMFTACKALARLLLERC